MPVPDIGAPSQIAPDDDEYNIGVVIHGVHR